MAEMDEQVVSAGLTRRRFLQVTGTTGVAAFLAACGGGLATGTPAATTTPAPASLAPGVTPSPTPQPTPSPTLGGTLHWANWPAYIDLTGAAADAGKYAPGSSPTIVNFQKQTGITVDYQEKIEDNAHFFATIQPQLVAGLSTGWDLIVMTDWMAAKLIAKSWIEKIDQSAVPNCVANLRDPLRNLVWDPGNDYHYPWQSGMTGVGYDSKALTTNNLTPPTSLADLWTIAMAHAKNISFLTESRDTFGLTMLKLGLDPSKVTVDTLQQAHDAIRPLVDAGLRFADNSYLEDFAQGRTWAAMVWSGDLAGSGTATEHFVFPTEGVMVWSDNMMIPKGATNQPAAQAMMNYVYDPTIAANIADYVFYISPVNGAADEIKKIDPDASTNPLLFPTPDIVAKQHQFQAPLDSDTEDTLNNLYLDLSGG